MFLHAGKIAAGPCLITRATAFNLIDLLGCCLILCLCLLVYVDDTVCLRKDIAPCFGCNEWLQYCDFEKVAV